MRYVRKGSVKAMKIAVPFKPRVVKSSWQADGGVQGGQIMYNGMASPHFVETSLLLSIGWLQLQRVGASHVERSRPRTT